MARAMSQTVDSGTNHGLEWKIQKASRLEIKRH